MTNDGTGSVNVGVVESLQRARAAEREQAQFYRALAAAAEMAGDEATAERLNGLHADEQHHLSRLTVRLVELGQALEDLSARAGGPPSLAGWEDAAREREAGEVARYEAMLRMPLDGQTAQMIAEFLEAERRHASELGGKWMEA